MKKKNYEWLHGKLLVLDVHHKHGTYVVDDVTANLFALLGSLDGSLSEVTARIDALDASIEAQQKKV